jgi:hypothetical protein
MTFQLGRLGSYRVERTEEYIPGGSDNSYAEMIRVRGSKADPPIFMVPSHLYKYSETELGLYLKELKNRWRPLGRILDQRFDISNAELMIHFPISKFSEVARIVPFVRKRGSGIQSEAFKEARRLTQFRAKNGDKTGQNETKTGGRVREGINLWPPRINRKDVSCQASGA